MEPAIFDGVGRRLIVVKIATKDCRPSEENFSVLGNPTFHAGHDLTDRSNADLLRAIAVADASGLGLPIAFSDWNTDAMEPTDEIWRDGRLHLRLQTSPGAVPNVLGERGR